MTKRQKLINQALALYRASLEMDKILANSQEMNRFTFWFYSSKKDFKNGAEARAFVNKMVRGFRG